MNSIASVLPSSPLVWAELVFTVLAASVIYRMGRHFLSVIAPHFKPGIVTRMNTFWTLLVTLGAVAVGVFTLNLSQVPVLFTLGHDLVGGLHQRAGQILLIVGLAFIAWNLVSAVSSRIVAPAQFDRRAVRVQTLKDVVDSTLRVVIVIISLAALLQTVGISPTSLLAGVSVMGVAVGFGAQNLVQDVFNGFFILLEGQYGVGDDIAINGGSLGGTVEDLSLRTTTLRDSTGAVHIIPNSQINTVTVTTRDWYGVNANVDISHRADADQALWVLGAVGNEMYADPQWQPMMIAAPQVQGVTALGLNAVTVQTFFKLHPKHQDAISMEFNRRVKVALQQAGIALAEPSRHLSFDSSALPAAVTGQASTPAAQGGQG